MFLLAVLMGVSVLGADEQEQKEDFWPHEHYGITIPPTNSLLAKQEYDRKEKKQLQNINSIVERVVNEENEECYDKKPAQKKRKKNKHKNCTKCPRGNTQQQAATKAVVDLLVPEIRLLLEKQYDDILLTEKKVTIKLHEVSLRKAIELVGKLTDINFVMDADVDGYIRNFSFNDASLAAVLSILLSNNLPRLALINDRGVWRILKQNVAIEELKVKAEKSIEQDTVADYITIHYVNWNAEFKKRIEQLWNGIVGHILIKSHYIVFDDESRKIFCRGRKNFVIDFKKALQEIDMHVPQVRIDARIVMVSKDFEEAIGFEWSGMYDRSASISQNGFQFAGIGVGTKNGSEPSGFENLLGWALNFIPTSISSIKTVQIPFSFGNKNLSTNRLNVMLNAAETKHELETILKPSLLVKSQECAEILVGQEMPQATVLQETVAGSPTNVTTIGYKDIGMKIKVKPTVAPDQKSIFLDIFVQNSFVKASTATISSSSNTSQLGSFPYTIMTSRSSNRVVLCDGQTTMISGLIENSKDVIHTGVPWIQEIPVIGWLFKGKRKKLEDKQLLIFITPTLV